MIAEHFLSIGNFPSRARYALDEVVRLALNPRAIAKAQLHTLYSAYTPKATASLRKGFFM